MRARSEARNDGDGLAIRGEHFELVTLGHVGARGIALDDHADIAGAKPLLGQVLRQHQRR